MSNLAAGLRRRSRLGRLCALRAYWIGLVLRLQPHVAGDQEGPGTDHATIQVRRPGCGEKASKAVRGSNFERERSQVQAA